MTSLAEFRLSVDIDPARASALVDRVFGARAATDPPATPPPATTPATPALATPSPAPAADPPVAEPAADAPTHSDVRDLMVKLYNAQGVGACNELKGAFGFDKVDKVDAEKLPALAAKIEEMLA